jgi:L,D-transpeptidase catalytic domain
MLVHLATPTAGTSPQQHRTHPVDGGGGAIVASVRPGRAVELRAKPAGHTVGVIGSRTLYGSRLTLPVVKQRGSWLGVVSAAMPNGRLGWVDAKSGALAFGRVKLELEADLSRRMLRVWARGHVIRRFTVGIGRAGSTTPTGRFSITDKLRGAAYGSYYGCCILALSGHQPHTPRGWTGGARLAIHGGSYGPVSAGCLHASTRTLRYLMRTVPLGTQVVIHP